MTLLKNHAIMYVAIPIIKQRECPQGTELLFVKSSPAAIAIPPAITKKRISQSLPESGKPL